MEVPNVAETKAAKRYLYEGQHAVKSVQIGHFPLAPHG